MVFAAKLVAHYAIRSAVIRVKEGEVDGHSFQIPW